MLDVMENAMVNSGLHKANSELSIIQEVNSELSVIQEVNSEFSNVQEVANSEFSTVQEVANSELSILQETKSHENVPMCNSNSNTTSSSSCKTAKVSFKKPLHSVSFFKVFIILIGQYIRL